MYVDCGEASLGRNPSILGVQRARLWLSSHSRDPLTVMKAKAISDCPFVPCSRRIATLGFLFNWKMLGNFLVKGRMLSLGLKVRL